jgi:SAM-dependent methyltransferase
MTTRVDLDEHLRRISESRDTDFRASSLNDLITEFVRPAQVLDIGCGTGGLSIRLARRGFSVTSQDPSSRMIDRCREVFSSQGLDTSRIRLGGIQEVTEEDFFDSVVALDVIEHIEDDLGALEKMTRALKPGGILVLSVPALSFLYGQKDRDVGHYRRYDKKVLLTLLGQAGIDQVRTRYWNLVGIPPVFVMSRLLKTRVPESFRYRQGSESPSVVNRLLRVWFERVENKLPMPIGLTLIATGVKT